MEWIASLPTVAKIALLLLEAFFSKKGMSDEERSLFLSLAKGLRERGITDAQLRYQSKDQIDAGNAEWEKREKETDNAAGS